MDPEGFAGVAARIEEQVRRVIVGQGDLVRGVLSAILAGGHVLIQGVPGLGKTVLVRALGDALDLRVNRVQFTPDLMPTDIVGTTVIQEHDGRRDFVFHDGPVFTNLLLADEINRATPKTQSALLEAMQERQVTAGGATRPLPVPFFVLATQNPIELEGTYPLPEAQLDRFLVQLLVEFPSDDELALILRRTTGAPGEEPEPVARAGDLLAMQSLARQVPVADHVLDYAVRLVAATHPERSGVDDVRRQVRFGASPRGAQAMVAMAKVRALLDGRPNVAFDDVAAQVLPALRHRVLLRYEAEAEGVDADALLQRIVDGVPRDPLVR
ncbi:MAG TPA: MoxR family ATPase [Candidatus Dormibacteraeota bacterium]|nr:MoxR family ATPase [Candidatus Dormibacteraeota bacterium]